jgi:mRNA-degrading endonuclease YafQ of YafQ-DinJ toxin-antitoxin module
MASASFSVFVTARFERDYQAILKRHPNLAQRYAESLMFLKQDPYNSSHRYAIKKLEGMAAGVDSIVSGRVATGSATTLWEMRCI